MNRLALTLTIIAISLCGFASAQDINMDGIVNSDDLFILSGSWGLYFEEDQGLDLLDNWRGEIDYQPADDSISQELTQEGQKPQVYVDHRGIANIIYVKRTPELAPDNSIVMTLQLACVNILTSGQHWMGEKILTEREPNIKVWGEYFGPSLNELCLVGPPDRQGDFFAVWKHYSSGFSMIRFNQYGVPVTGEYVASSRRLDDVERFNATMDNKGNIHIAWAEVQDETNEVYYSKFSPEGDMLIDPPVSVGSRLTSSGSSELFHPVIRRLDTSNMLIMIHRGESKPTLAVKVDGTDGAILDSRYLEENFVEPDYLEMPNGDIAMAAMIFKVGKGRDVFFTVLNPDLSIKVDPVNLSRTTQQSDGASIEMVEDDLYVAWNENSDNHMRLVRLNANGSRQGKVKKLSGPGIGSPYRLRMDTDPSGLAHITYADEDGIPAKVFYEKIKID
jgi:hypothetical protein